MFKAGFYEKEITPPLGTTIFGYFARRVNTGVKDKLYAKAAVFENNGEYAAFLAIDSMCMPPDLPETVRQRVQKNTPIDGNSILIGVTHSHTSGPCEFQSEFKNRKEKDVVTNPELDRQWMQMLALLAADAVILAYQRLSEATISFAIGKAEDVSFVRNCVLRDGSIRTGGKKEDIIKHYSQADPSLPLFFVTDKNDNPLGAITSFALHHDTVGGSEVSADFSGVVARKLKDEFGVGFVSVFFAGFGGDINHINRLGEPFKRTTEEIGSIIADEIIKTAAKAEVISTDSIKIGMEKVNVAKRHLPEGRLNHVKNLMDNPPPEPPAGTVLPSMDCDEMLYLRANRYLDLYDDDITGYDVFVQVIKIGDCLIYALISEMFSCFADKLRKQSPTDKLMTVAYANTDGMTGTCSDIYIPIPELFVPTLYEAAEFSAMLKPEAGDIMTDKAIEIANRL